MRHIIQARRKREYNQNHSKRRIVIEHIIYRLKKFRILAQIFRNKLRKYDKVTDIVYSRHCKL